MPSMAAMSWSVQQSSVAPSVRLQQQALLVPVAVQRRHVFRRRSPLRHQVIVRAEQKDNGKDGKPDKKAEKLVKGVRWRFCY